MSSQATTFDHGIPQVSVEERVTDASRDRRRQRLLRWLSLLPVPITWLLQLPLWDRWVRPFGLLLFVQAIYLSSWFGGLYVGLVATFASVVLAYYYFVPPERSWALTEPSPLLALALFFALGILVTLFHERFRRTTRALTAALAEGERKNETVRGLTTDLQAVSRAAVSVAEAVATLPHQSVEAVLHTIATQAQNLAAAEFVGVGIGTDPERSFDPWVFVGLSPEQAAMIAGGRHPRPVGVLGYVVSHGVPLRLRDLREHPQHRRLPEGHPEMTSFLGVPICFRERAVGHLYLANKRGAAEFTDADQRVVEQLATRAGVALETAHLYATQGTARAWLEAVVEQLPDAVLLFDVNGRIAMINRAATELGAPDDGRRDPFGNPLPLELRFSDGDLVPPDAVPYVRAIQHDEAELGCELTIRAGDRVIPVSVSAVPVHGLDGKTAGAIALFRDLSPQKEIERMRDEWSAVVAHDLRQPVSVISLAAELVRRGHGDTVSPSEAKHLDRIQHATRRLRDMIDELLDVAQLDSRRLLLARTEVDVAKSVREVSDRMGVAEMGHPVTVRELGERRVVEADPSRLEQVLSNLISNACKYGNPETEIRIDVEGRKDEVEVSVTNWGRGIPKDEVPKLFQRFMRGTTSRASSVSGIGLGLYICKGIVEAHKGRIWVESTPNETTTFHVTLPVRSAAPEGAS